MEALEVLELLEEFEEVEGALEVDFISVDFERKIGKRQKYRERKRKISEKREFLQKRFF